MARKRRRLGAIGRDEIMIAAGKMKGHCLNRWKTRQFISTCSRTVDRMTKALLNQGPELTSHNVANAANEVDKKCAKYSPDKYGRNQYGTVCFKVVAGFIRQLTIKNPGLQGRR